MLYIGNNEGCYFYICPHRKKIPGYAPPNYRNGCLPYTREYGILNFPKCIWMAGITVLLSGLSGSSDLCILFPNDAWTCGNSILCLYFYPPYIFSFSVIIPLPGICILPLIHRSVKHPNNRPEPESCHI